MKTQTLFTDIAQLERELTSLAPLVRQAFNNVGGPSTEVENTIREEAHRCAARGKSRFSRPLFQTLAAAACLVLVLGGALQLHLNHQSATQSIETAVRQKIGENDSQTPDGKTDETSRLARLLLDIQGLDAESYFTSEATEALWL